MELRPVSRALALCFGLLLAATAHAQDRGMTPLAGFGAHDTAPARAESPHYGTTGLTYVRVPGIEFVPVDGSSQGFPNSLERWPVSSSRMYAPLHLPGGAIIDYLEIDFYDNLDPEDIQLFIVDCGSLGSSCANVANINSFGIPGYGAISTSGINYQVDNLGGSLALKAIFGAVDNSQLSLIGAIVGYRLQVSPAPANATFVDVPTDNIYFQFIEALAASGITSGCVSSPPQFCPDRPITRAEMAVFLSKALGLNFP